MDSNDVLEVLKIGIAIVVAYIIIKALLYVGDTEQAKQCCECIKEGVIYLGGTK